MKKNSHAKLSEFAATAICGNDILSSALYVSGIAAIFAGLYAPLVLLLVAGVLYLYRAVYREVVEALPINGGAYNCLLNATSKTFAAVAGVMTILSYIATAVISAKVGVEYLHSVFTFIPVIVTTIVLLGLFALLVISGVRDSAKVAGIIFAVHLFTLTAFVAAGIVFILKGNTSFSINILATTEIINKNGGLLKALFLAFSASLLGISGFESSANFVEEQAPGVFPKTLKNMWLGVTIFNPMIALVVLAALSLPAIGIAKDFVLADAASTIGGSLFGYLVVADAFLVLSGAVLTSYVGVAGLIHRMSLDGCLPAVLLKKNKSGAHPRIVITFFLLCASILFITRGQLLSLAGVYTISFLGVMSLFALGNLILRETRADLKRAYKAPWVFVVLAFFATLAGVVGNIIVDNKNVIYFGIYFLPAVFVVLAMIYRDDFFRLLLRVVRPFPHLAQKIAQSSGKFLDNRFVVFVHKTNRLFDAISYIDRNETGRDVTLVHCRDNDCFDEAHDDSYAQLKQILPVLTTAGAFTHFTLKTLYKHKTFGPEVIEEVSKELRIPKNRIFIGSIHHFHEFDYSELGGVRIISG